MGTISIIVLILADSFLNGTFLRQLAVRLAGHEHDLELHLLGRQHVKQLQVDQLNQLLVGLGWR